MILSKKELQAMGCGNPNCTMPHDIVVLSSNCHMGAPVQVIYDKGAGALVTACAICGEIVAVVAVAEEAPDEVKLHDELVSRVPAPEGVH